MCVNKRQEEEGPHFHRLPLYLNSVGFQGKTGEREERAVHADHTANELLRHKFPQANYPKREEGV